jgi:hypothetical protein
MERRSRPISPADALQPDGMDLKDSLVEGGAS